MIYLEEAYEQIDELFKNRSLKDMELLITIAKEKYMDKQILDSLSGKNKMKILVLEDDSIRIETFKEKLKKEDVDYVEHACDAVNLLKTNTYDFIFLDHDLNGTQMEYQSEDCGTVVAKYMFENKIDIPTIIHSYNLPASVNMSAMIKSSIYVAGIWMLKTEEIYAHMENQIQWVKDNERI